MITITLQFDTINEASDWMATHASTPAPTTGDITEDKPAKLTPQQKAAATRAKNKAIKAAEFAKATKAAATPPAAPGPTSPVQPAPAAPAAQPVSLTSDQVRDELNSLAQRMGDNGAAIFAVLKDQFHVSRLPDLEPVNYGPYLEACRALEL